MDYTESFTSRNALSTGFLSNPLVINQATGSVSDGDGGANYSVTYLNSTAGAILPLAITVTANAVTKVYDGGTSVATATPSIDRTPSITGGSLAAYAGPGGLDTADFSETYASATAGTQTLIPSGSVNDGNGGLNYSVTFVDNPAGEITHTAIKFLVTALTSGLPVTAGANFLLLVEAEDSSNSIVTSYAGSPTLSSTDPKVLTLPGALNFSSGYAYTLASLETVAGGPWTITATDATNPLDKISGTSNSITVSNASASQVVLSTIANTSAGTAIGVTATVEDPYGNPVLGNSSSVTLTASGPGSALYGTDAMTAVNGVAAFSTSGPGANNVNIRLAGNGYQLTATAALPGGAGTFTATSDPFTVSSGPAVQLAFTTQPEAVVAGAKTFTAGVTVEDLYGNAVTGDDSSVTVSLQKAATYTGDSNGLLSSTSGSLTASDYQDNGVAAFSGLSISQPGTGYSAAGSGYYLKASDGSMSVNSAPFNTTLIVTGVAMTSTGFTATFSEPFDPTQVNLYGRSRCPA